MAEAQARGIEIVQASTRSLRSRPIDAQTLCVASDAFLKEALQTYRARA